MSKKTNKKICALLLICLMGALSSISVIAAEETANVTGSSRSECFGRLIYGYYIEPCWICNKGDIYRETKIISKHTGTPVLCQNGHTQEKDNCYVLTYALINTCNICGYGWTEPIKRTVIKCEDH